MLKLMAILRSLVLLGLVAYLLWAMPLGVLFSGAATRQATSFRVEVIEGVARAAWLALVWIGVETAIGWARVWLAARQAAKSAAPAPAPPKAP